MQFDPPLQRAILQKRYKRFLADIVFDDGTETTAHCANPGAMLGLARTGAEIWVQPATNPKRKLKFTWKLERLASGGFAGIDTSVPNQIVKEALQHRNLSEFSGYQTVLPEQKYGSGSRIDFLLKDGLHPDCYLEVKNVHLERVSGLAEFPDSVTARGTKHLKELALIAANGGRAAMLYVVQMDGPSKLRFASDIDPAYARAVADAKAVGVDMLAYATDIDTKGIVLTKQLPVEL